MTSSAEPVRPATLHDVARASGVSRGTVSRHLNGERYVSETARVAIEQAIVDVGYVPNTAARNLVRRRTQAVAFIVHEPHALFLEDPNIAGILLGTNTALSDADYQMVCLIVDSDRDTQRVARYLNSGFVDGAIVVSARENDPVSRIIEKLRIPAVFVGHPRGVDAAWVGIDNRAAAASVTTRLRDTGRQRIAMIAAALDRDSGTDRLAGFRDALGELFDERLVESVPLYSYSDGVDGMRALLAREPLLDGVFAASDAVAAGALSVLHSAGRTVPGDVGLVGFDDSSWATRTTPQLTTVHQPAAQLGAGAAAELLHQIGGAPASSDGVILECPVVWRDSA
ncbi:LacI family DNA-binding transcriptional regulator [Demequina oxidasica]|uniref:LacI family DNA-binding transcriptional regulator n=1 Tax=Demequina oxidasica TaxID=676199 RepID=UPI000781EEA7|nr:LacI family DNA-binding transcriptional regulator [Demequina oxidasica]